MIRKGLDGLDDAVLMQIVVEYPLRFFTVHKLSSKIYDFLLEKEYIYDEETEMKKLNYKLRMHIIPRMQKEGLLIVTGRTQRGVLYRKNDGAIRHLLDDELYYTTAEASRP
ncbi:MAG: hypothetical protein QXU98_12795 [Candidatus Parvarchaeota archaeon]